jgi:hypothetical protein
MGAVTDWQCFLISPDEASAVPVAHYLRLRDCPALVFVQPPGFDFALQRHEFWFPPNFCTAHTTFGLKRILWMASPTGNLNIWLQEGCPARRWNHMHTMTPPNNAWSGRDV